MENVSMLPRLRCNREAYTSSPRSIYTTGEWHKHMPVRGYNTGHAIKLAIRPIRDFVDATLWMAVSQKKLMDEPGKRHRTKPGQDANHRECTNYFAGTGDYKGLITSKTTNAVKVLQSVPYPKVTSDQTHEDRWFLYCMRRDKALQKVPDVQRQIRKFVRAHTAHLRKILAPPALNAVMTRAFDSGIHPDTQQYDELMDLDYK